jgi:hypothetical protein
MVAFVDNLLGLIGDSMKQPYLGWAILIGILGYAGITLWSMWWLICFIWSCAHGHQ